MMADNISADVLFEACTAGNLASLQRLLQEPAYITKALEMEERVDEDLPGLTHCILNLSSMLNKAAVAGSSDTVRYLLSFAHTHDVPYEKLLLRDCIGSAISSNNNVAVFKELLAVKADIIDFDMGHSGTPLSQAVAGNRNAPLYSADRTPLVRFLLEGGADPNRIQAPYDAPGAYLQDAVRRSSLEVIELLLQHGARIEQSSAMHRAAEKGRIDVMELLLERGADVNEQLVKNVWYSASYRTKFKKENGIVSDVSDDPRPKWSHETPLHYSVLHRQVEATAWLVKNGADANIADSKGWTPRDMATKMGDMGILEALTSAAGTE
ncbi:ankyrin repeat-containing domain protein [Clohesyomyces aquaticus]|uniref:Ankyrin repeat-containing domain protein n=1 Tax=Clohesyomyces aquaticus TaxID=1231657 RepID=A0A1Y1YYL3_9PLEO|nr:ankyrin repeat-containing domain protein [Clohesyomyces aquaticus]